MQRRDFLSAALGAAAASALFAAKPARNHIGRSQISAITDEIGRSPAASVAFAKQYGLQWLELRDVPGAKIPYFHMSDEDLKAAAAEFRGSGIRISFLNSAMLKYGLPGTDPIRRTPEKPEDRDKRRARQELQFANRIKDLEDAIRAAHILGVSKVRVFTFLRVSEPETLYQQTADVIGELDKIAHKEGVWLLIENEGSCNVATSAELAVMSKLVPSTVGINWDPHNAIAHKENPYPDGYKLLPIKRVGNVQVKGRSIIETYGNPAIIDWAGVFQSLEKDGYQGEIGLETHIFGEKQVEASHASMEAILKLVEPS